MLPQFFWLNRNRKFCTTYTNVKLFSTQGKIIYFLLIEFYLKLESKKSKSTILWKNFPQMKPEKLFKGQIPNIIISAMPVG